MVQEQLNETDKAVTEKYDIFLRLSYLLVHTSIS